MLKNLRITFTELTMEPLASQALRSFSLGSVNIGITPHKIGNVPLISRAPCAVLHDDVKMDLVQAEQRAVVLRHNFLDQMRAGQEYTTLAEKAGIISADIVPASPQP